MISSTSKADWLRSPTLWGSLVIVLCVLLAVAGSIVLLVEWALTEAGPFENEPYIDSDRRSSGWCAKWLGDVDQDGGDDFLLSTTFEPDGARNFGIVRIVSGRDGSMLSGMRLWNGPGFENAAPAGDVDGDGRVDLFVRDWASDGTRVVSADLTTEILAFKHAREFEVRPAGDLDADGHGDMLIAECGVGGGDSRGRVRVLSGADGSALREHVGEEDDEYFGWDACDLGDIDGDGTPDYAISTAPSLYRYKNKRADSFVVVYSGRDGHVLRKIRGVREGGFQSWLRLAPTGDVDRDGVNDLLLGGVSNNASGVWDGIGLALVSGQEGTFLWRRHMKVSYYEFGDAGDVNGDGCSDLRFGRDESWRLESGCGGETLSTAKGESWGTGSGDANGDGHADLLRLTNSWEPQGPDLWKDGVLEVVSGKDRSVLFQIDEYSLSGPR